MKENCIIMDTNILTEYKNNLNEIKEKVIHVADIFIPRIVIEEVKGQKTRNIRDDYMKIKTIINKNNNLFKYSEKFKLEDIILSSEKDITKWIETYCDKKILEHKEINLNDIIERAKYKKAPFINEQNSSDKGFKDSIIWLSILKNENLKSYKKIILLTNDKTGFIKRTKDLYDEYNQEHKVQLIFCCSLEELYKCLKLDKTDEKIEKSEENVISPIIESENVNDIKNELNNCINNILFSTYEDDWGNVHCNQNFNIFTKMNNEDVECFLESLDNFLKNNIFFNDLDITELLLGCGIESAGENVSSEQLNKLNEIYKNIKNNKELYNPFITFLNKEFNKLFKYKPIVRNVFDDIDETDLPF